MPVIRFLQDVFRVPAVHVPMGQASDAAHLPNERIRVTNLRRVGESRRIEGRSCVSSGSGHVAVLFDGFSAR